MLKNYIYAGLVLLVIGVVMLYLISSYITTGTPTQITNFTVLAHTIGYVPVRVNSSGISILFVFAYNNTNIYLLNQSVFTGLSAYLEANTSASAYNYVTSRKVNSTEIFANNSTAVKEFSPTTSNNVPGNKEIYAVMDSTQGSPSYNSVVGGSVVYKSYSYGSWEDNSVESLIGVIMFIAGMALLIYGAIKKPKEETQNEDAQKQAAPAKKRKST